MCEYNTKTQLKILSYPKTKIS